MAYNYPYFNATDLLIQCTHTQKVSHDLPQKPNSVANLLSTLGVDII